MTQWTSPRGITGTPRVWASTAGGATVTSEAVPGGVVFAVAVFGSVPGAGVLLAVLQGAGVGLVPSGIVTLAVVLAVLVAAGVQLVVRDKGMSPRHTDAARAARGLAPLDETDIGDDGAAADERADRVCVQDARCAVVTPLHAPHSVRGFNDMEGGAA